MSQISIKKSTLFDVEIYCAIVKFWLLMIKYHYQVSMVGITMLYTWFVLFLYHTS